MAILRKSVGADRRNPVHKIDISQETHAAARRWRGSVHLFEHIDPKRTAHLVVDLQNVFMEPGAPVEVPVARDIVPNVNFFMRVPVTADGSAAVALGQPCGLCRRTS